jgi:hypothetical protein
MTLFVATSPTPAEHPALFGQLESWLHLPMVPAGRLIN